MKVAIWIIAITEVVRAAQNMMQLWMLAEEKRKAEARQNEAFEKYVEAMDRSNEIKLVFEDEEE